MLSQPNEPSFSKQEIAQEAPTPKEIEYIKMNFKSQNFAKLQTAQSEYLQNLKSKKVLS